MTITAYPLAWPPGWKRTDSYRRTEGNFRTKSAARGEVPITIAQATKRLREELGRMGVSENRHQLIVSTNLALRQDGLPYSNQNRVSDPGAAVYWTDPWTGQPRCMAIDRYTKVEQNIAALAATIDAMRAIERHGGAVVLERAFTGFTSLPAPTTARHWWEVLECQSDSPVIVIRAQYQRLASNAHPDKGGSHERMAELNRARDEGLQASRELA